MSPCPSGSTPSPGPRLGTNVAASPPALLPRRVPGGCQQSPVETLIIVWCLLQQPPDPTTQQPTQPVPSPWTQGQGHPKTAHLPLEGPAWALPTLPPPHPCFFPLSFVVPSPLMYFLFTFLKQRSTKALGCLGGESLGWGVGVGWQDGGRPGQLPGGRLLGRTGGVCARGEEAGRSG